VFPVVIQFYERMLHENNEMKAWFLMQHILICSKSIVKTIRRTNYGADSQRLYVQFHPAHFITPFIEHMDRKTPMTSIWADFPRRDLLKC
jgi:hypothetical protein